MSSSERTSSGFIPRSSIRCAEQRDVFVGPADHRLQALQLQVLQEWRGDVVRRAGRMKTRLDSYCGFLPFLRSVRVFAWPRRGRSGTRPGWPRADPRVRLARTAASHAVLRDVEPGAQHAQQRHVQAALGASARGVDHAGIDQHAAGPQQVAFGSTWSGVSTTRKSASPGGTIGLSTSSPKRTSLRPSRRAGSCRGSRSSSRRARRGTRPRPGCRRPSARPGRPGRRPPRW